MAKISPLNSNTSLVDGSEDEGFTVSRPFQSFLNQIEALKVKVGSDQIGIHIDDDGIVRIGDGVDNYVEFGTNGLIRSEPSIWWHARHLSIFSASPGASGATWTAPDANTLGGYQLNATAEKLYFSTSITSKWDGESDLQFRVAFEVNTDNSGGAVTDTVDLQLICYYKAHEAIVNKTQTLEVATTVGQSVQYKRWVTVFNVNWDETDNVVAIGDKMSVILNLETDTSEVDDIIINNVMFRYKTKQVSEEV